MKYSYLQCGTGLPKRATKPHGLPGEARVTTLRPQVRLDHGGTRELLQLWKTSRKILWLLQIPQEKGAVARNEQSLGARVERRRQLLTSLTISLTSHGYFDSWLTMWSQSRCCLPLPATYLQIEFTLLFSCHVPKVHLLPSSLSLPLPQLLPSQHLISIHFQFPLRLFIKV